MSSGLILKIHLISVTVFLVFYLLKTYFLLTGKTESLESWAKSTRIAEMIFASLFLVSGIWLFAIIGGIKTLQVIKLVLVLVSIPLAVIGFKRKIKGYALISFVMLISAYGLADTSRGKPFPVKHPIKVFMSGNPETGKLIFEGNCVYCHGKDGKKMYRDASDLTLSIKEETKVETVIRNGNFKGMPAYGGLLGDKEITSLAEYIMTLRIQ